MPILGAQYSAVPPTPQGYLPSRAPVSQAKGRSRHSASSEEPRHHDSNATITTPDALLLPGPVPKTNDPFPPSRGNAPPKTPLSKRRSMKQDYKTEIILACLLLLLPLPLSAVLMYLIYVNLQPRNQYFGFPDSLTVDNTNRSLSNQEYYVNYSATRLVFISSLSSTLALALVPVAMTLFAYMAAFTLQKASNTGKICNLPSPFQFELTVQLLGGNITALYRYLKYIFRRKQKRMAAVPVLNTSALVLALMLVLALCITLVDAFLHIRTSTVQYHNTGPYLDTEFNPGRRLSTDCWNVTSLQTIGSCNYNPGGSGAAASFSNSTEAYLTLGNQSTRNTIRLSDNGKTAVITPSKIPAGVQFTAQSYASSTTCETVTKRCKPHYNGDGYCDACQSWAYNCTPDATGMQISGNFSDIALGGGSFPTVLQFFNTSSKLFNTSLGPVHGQVWSAVLFSLPTGTDGNLTDGDNILMIGDMNYDPAKDLIADTYGNIYGILSCNTTLSEATYSVRADGSTYNAITKPMNDTAGAAFYGPFSNGFGNDNLGSGANLAAASADSSEDLAYQIGRVFDRTLLGLSAGSLPDRQAVLMVHTGTKQVAKVPIAEFVALIVLNLVLPVVGVIQGVWAWVLCTRHGVRDVQAMLGIGPLLAALFEDEKFHETATNVEELFAETRGLPSARVAVEARENGGGQVFAAIAENSDEREQ